MKFCDNCAYFDTSSEASRYYVADDGKKFYLCPVCAEAFELGQTNLGADLLGIDYLENKDKTITRPKLSKVGHKIGDYVKVRAPKGNNAWSFPFTGHVTDITDRGNLIVEDQDSDFFEVEPDEVEK